MGGSFKLLTIIGDWQKRLSSSPLTIYFKPLNFSYMKNLNTLIILALAFSFSIATAQTAPGKQWDARFGGSDNDGLSSLKQTANGGYILGASSYSGISRDKTQASQGSADSWIENTLGQEVFFYTKSLLVKILEKRLT